MNVWLLQDGEPLPIDDSPRLMRTGLVAEAFLSLNCSVTWFSSNVSHSQKVVRESDSHLIQLEERYQLCLLQGLSYSRNLSIRRLFSQLRTGWQFLKVAPTLPQPDVIVASYPSPELCFAGSRFAIQNQIPLVVDVRDPWPVTLADYFSPPLRLFVLPLTWYYTSLARYAVRASRSVYATSARMLEWAQSLHSLRDTKRDRVFYHGYRRRNEAASLSNEAGATPFSTQNPMNCVFVGTFGHSYDGELIIETMRILQNRSRKEIRCVMIGDGEFFESWKKKAHGLDNIEFTGWVDAERLDHLLKDAHLGFFFCKGGTRHYTVPNKIFEYMSYGLTVIDCSSEEVSKLIQDHEVGYSAREWKGEDVADLLIQLASSPDPVNKHCANGIRAFQNHFSSQRVYMEYCQQVMECKRDGDES